MQAKPIVALVGRPNVGKSTLFNRLIGDRLAITEGQPGTTRDRIYGDSVWNGREFVVVDTGGIDPTAQRSIERLVQDQARIAMAEADVVVFIVDADLGLTPSDTEVADLLRQTVKPVLVAANKAENLSRQLASSEFYTLGLGEPITVSALHGMGTGDLLDAVVQSLPAANDAEEAEEDDGCIRVAILGRPNVGKSSLFNALIGQERVIVSEIPGTTRDSIDTLIVREGRQFLFIDTAGIRRRGHIQPGVEKYSVMRSVKAIDRCDVAILVIDAVEGLTDGDLHIAGRIKDEAKGLIVAVNKWDLVEKDDRTADAYAKEIRRRLDFMDYAPILFISALTHQRVHRIFDDLIAIDQERGKRIATPMLNNFAETVQQHHVAMSQGRTLKIYYVTQPATHPPTFIFFVNDAKIAHFSYSRYLENELRRAFGFRGTPLRVVLRGKVERER